jgi:hypothetical protein
MMSGGAFAEVKFAKKRLKIRIYRLRPKALFLNFSERRFIFFRQSQKIEPNVDYLRKTVSDKSNYLQNLRGVGINENN